MIREIPEKEWRLTDLHQLNFEWDGHWVVFWSPKPDSEYDGTGYVVAYGNGTAKDRDTLREKIIRNRYHGNALIQRGRKPGNVYYCGTQSEGI